MAEFASNNVTLETTSVSLFFANYGFHLCIGVEPAHPCLPNVTEAQRHKFFHALEIAAQFKAILDKATALARQAQDRYKEGANRRQDNAPAYRVGDKVMLNIRNCKTGQPVQKLEPRWEGPFEVTKASLYAVTLRLPANMKIFNTFHVSMVRLYQGASIEG